MSTAQVDWSDAGSVIEYLLGYARMLAGSCRPFDETTAGELVRRDLERARAFPTVQNHHSIPDDDRTREPLSSIGALTLVIHGSADPMFPIEHGEALAAEISEAKLLRLKGAGHGVAHADWQTIFRAILEHTGHKIAPG